jgi:molybdenum cofactor cytidylyltransferase
MQLIKALRYSAPSCMAFVGAGGKTSAMFTTGRELLSTNPDQAPIKTVFATTTTHLGAWQAKLGDHLIFGDSTGAISQLSANIPEGLVILAGGECNDQLEGIKPHLLAEVYKLVKIKSLPLLIEADGAKLRPLKAPASHEPVIPDFCQHVVVIAGMQGIGKPLDASWVHRPEIFAELSGLPLGSTVTPEALVKVLSSDLGGLKNIPQGAKRSIILNQADTDQLREQAISMSAGLLERYSTVVVGSIIGFKNTDFANSLESVESRADIHAVVEKIGAIILAAGGSRRFGSPKQLVKWKGEPLIMHVIRAAQEAGLSPIVVVVGSSSEKVISELSSQDLRIVNNSQWEKGLSGSIKVGLDALPETVGGAVFLQADQPQVPSKLIQRLVETHQRKLSPIVAPWVNGQRGNPVLFDASTFIDLASLSGDLGGRVLFDRYPVEWVPWEDPRLVLDIDSPGDYQKFLDQYPEDQATE